MTLTQKETSLLMDLKSQEMLCIEKYGKYADEACDPELSNLFQQLRSTEESHLKTITDILGGIEVSSPPKSPSAAEAMITPTPSGVSADEKADDAFLAKDALSMEKHVSAVYDTSVFEFSSPVLRDKAVISKFGFTLSLLPAVRMISS